MPEDASAVAPNMLTDAEREAGWRLLFDGVSTEHWRGYRAETFPDGWVIDDGALHRAAPAGDIITVEQFADEFVERHEVFIAILTPGHSI